ncbi:anaphase-promoting complex subunit Hcn1 [Entophlyctis luteolus]|nr:anaphase-promoting complex subunit Hcn1 [Entophlyctis luteolus]
MRKFSAGDPTQYDVGRIPKAQRKSQFRVQKSMSNAQKLREYKNELIKKIEILRSEFLSRTDDLMTAIIFMDTGNSRTDETHALPSKRSKFANSQNLDASLLELGIRSSPDDYKAPISANKTSRPSLYDSKNSLRPLPKNIRDVSYSPDLGRRNTVDNSHESFKKSGNDLSLAIVSNTTKVQDCRAVSNDFRSKGAIHNSNDSFGPRIGSDDDFAAPNHLQRKKKTGLEAVRLSVTKNASRSRALREPLNYPEADIADDEEEDVVGSQIPSEVPISHEFDNKPNGDLLQIPVHSQLSVERSSSAKVSSRHQSTGPSRVPTFKLTLRKTAKEEFQSNLFLIWFLLPSFDNKGGLLDLEEFDSTDFDNVSFLTCGFHPRSKFNTFWDLYMAVVYSLSVWLIPLLICYVPTNLDVYSPAYITAEFSLKASVFFHLRYAGFDSDANAEKGALNVQFQRLRAVAINLASVDMGMDEIGVFSSINIGEWARIPRVYQLIAKLNECAVTKRFKQQTEKYFGNGTAATIPISIVILTVIHWNSCLMYLFGKWAGFNGWSTAWDDFAGATSILQFYTWTFYQTLGNMLPMSFMFHSTVEQILAIISMVIGSVMFATFIGAISAATLARNSSEKLYNQKMDELLDFIKWKKLPKDTKHRLISYYETKYRGKYFEEDAFLKNMNESLRTEVALHNTRQLIEQVPFLRRTENDGRDEIFFGRIAATLSACYFTPGDYITKQGDSGLDMFFILHGKVNIFVNNVRVVSLYDGSYIGEVALIRKCLRTATVQAAMPSVLYRLTSADFDKILDDFCDMKAKIQKMTRPE